MSENVECRLDTRTRGLLMALRQALIMVLGALEDYLGLPRSITPRRKRERDVTLS